MCRQGWDLLLSLRLTRISGLGVVGGRDRPLDGGQAGIRERGPRDPTQSGIESTLHSLTGLNQSCSTRAPPSDTGLKL